jgi:hypothetical protein
VSVCDSEAMKVRDIEDSGGRWSWDYFHFCTLQLASFIHTCVVELMKLVYLLLSKLVSKSR